MGVTGLFGAVDEQQSGTNGTTNDSQDGTGTRVIEVAHEVFLVYNGKVLPLRQVFGTQRETSEVAGPPEGKFERHPDDSDTVGGRCVICMDEPGTAACLARGISTLVDCVCACVRL